MKIYLVRHGQTDRNKEHRVQGRNGLPLNDIGIQQAKNLSIKLNGIKFDYVYSSPQERAIQTAQIACGKNPIIDERLNVYDLGTADGLKTEEVKTTRGGLIPDPEIYSGVEPVEDYVARVFNFMDELSARFSKEDVTILISGHKCTTGCISAYFEGMPSDGNFLNLSSGNAEYKLFDTLATTKR